MISSTNIEKIKQFAISKYPQECVCVIVDDKFFELDNIHKTPEVAFKVCPKQYKKSTKGATDIILVHSHPEPEDAVKQRYFRFLKWDQRTPSRSDQITAAAMDIPFAIVSCSAIECSEPLYINTGHDIPLLRRIYVHGHTDCYAAIRDYYKLEYGIELENIPREWNWWHDEPELDLYQKLFDMGFSEVDNIEDIENGDIILFNIDSEIANHSAIYIDYNKIYHHLVAQLSCRESLAKYSEHIHSILRHTKRD